MVRNQIYYKNHRYTEHAIVWFNYITVKEMLNMWYDTGVSFKEIEESEKVNFELVPNNKGYLVILDYTNTIDELESNLSSIKKNAYGKVITVFGCDGNKDKSCRTNMGKVAGKWSDICYITTDNPMSIEPEKILNDIEEGIKKTACFFEKIENRKEAIFKALDNAKQGDIVIIAGKGHERYQMFANHVVNYSDKEVALEYFHLMPRKISHISKVS